MALSSLVLPMYISYLSDLKFFMNSSTKVLGFIFDLPRPAVIGVSINEGTISKTFIEVLSN